MKKKNLNRLNNFEQKILVHSLLGFIFDEDNKSAYCFFILINLSDGGRNGTQKPILNIAP
jgi:hypothetical protein